MGGAAPDLYSYVNDETRTYVAAMAVKPTDARKGALDTFIGVFKLVGWSKFGAIYIHRSHDEQAGRVNAKAPGTATLSPVNAPTFTADGGFASDGSTSYLDLVVGFESFAELGLNDNHLASVFTGTGVGVFGWGRSTTTGRFSLASVNGAGTSFQVRLTANSLINIANTVAAGYFVATRRGASSVEGYKDAASLGTSSVASTDLGSTSGYLLSSAGSFAPATARLELSHLWSQLSAGEVSALKTGLDNYFAAL